MEMEDVEDEELDEEEEKTSYNEDNEGLKSENVTGNIFGPVKHQNGRVLKPPLTLRSSNWRHSMFLPNSCSVIPM
jgi:hypothetical protein